MIPYRIALEIGKEPREAPATFDSFEDGVKACVKYALANVGIKVRMFVSVPQNALVEHHYTVFEVLVPRLEPFMRAGIKKHFGEEPPI